MAMINVTFPGGTKVTAHFGQFSVPTDQPINDGGTDTAPEPYMLFLSSIITCAGFYVLRFCQQRELPTEGLTMGLDIERNSETRQLEKVKLSIGLPEGFPSKYQRAIIRAAEMCSVKKALMNPPEFEIVTE